MRVLFFILLLFIGISCSKVSPQGDIQVQEVGIKDFDALELKGNFKVFYVKNPKSRLSVETYPNVFSNLKIENDGNTLVIVEKRKTEGVDFCNITIYSPKSFSMIELSEVAELNISSQMMVNELKINLKDQSKFIGSVLSNKADISMSNRSRLNLLGKCLDAKISLKDSASIIAPYWYVNQLNIHSKNANYTEISVDETLQGKLENTSKLHYYGNPTKNITQKDQSIIEKKEF